jgi:hypothetical protein
MSKEDKRKRSGRASYFDSHNSPWHFPRTIWSGGPKILAVSEPVIHKDPKGFAPTIHLHLRAPRPNYQLETAASHRAPCDLHATGRHRPDDAGRRLCCHELRSRRSGRARTHAPAMGRVLSDNGKAVAWSMHCIASSRTCPSWRRGQEPMATAVDDIRCANRATGKRPGSRPRTAAGNTPCAVSVASLEQ